MTTPVFYVIFCHGVKHIMYVCVRVRVFVDMYVCMYVKSCS